MWCIILYKEVNGEVFHCTPCSFRLADAYYANESVKLLADENKIKYKVV